MRIFIIFLNLFLFSHVYAAPLPAKEAFHLSAHFAGFKQLVLQWEVASGYYLYANKIHLHYTPDENGKLTWPPSIKKKISDGEIVAVYTGTIQIPIQLVSSEPFHLTVDYQGCSEKGFCYPPIQSVFQINPKNQSIFFEEQEKNPIGKNLLTNHQSIKNLFQTKHAILLWFIFMGIGLLLAFTPCVLPMIPILASIIVGQETVNTRKAFFLSLSYVLGSAIIYAIAGILAALLGSSLQVWLQKPWIIVISSFIFILLALSLFGFYDLNLPRAWQNRLGDLNSKQKRGTYAGAFMMGILSTLIVSPCVTAPLVGILMYISETGNVFLGGQALFALGLGMGIPLLAVGVSAGKWLPRRGPWMEGIKKVFGVVMLVLAFWLLLRVISFPAFLSNESDAFVVVTNTTTLNDELMKAKNRQCPVLIDFYADWCESCVIMDKKVFQQEMVLKALQHYILLRVDLSDSDTIDEALLKKFHVIAPPTVLFLNGAGQELLSSRIIGEVNEQEFIQKLPEQKDIGLSC